MTISPFVVLIRTFLLVCSAGKMPGNWFPEELFIEDGGVDGATGWELEEEELCEY